VAEALAEACAARYGLDEAEVLGRCKGAALEHQLLQHPFLERQVPVILGEHVTVDAGTGAVHTAPAHGQEDYAVGQRYDLPVDNPVAGNGVFCEGTPHFEGQHVFKANAPSSSCSPSAARCCTTRTTSTPTRTAGATRRR
jgi:isoleucyl-tRNA synthetase